MKKILWILYVGFSLALFFFFKNHWGTKEAVMFVGTLAVALPLAVYIMIWRSGIAHGEGREGWLDR